MSPDTRIEVVVYRDPDGPNTTDVFIDGEPVGDPHVFNVDPGAGHTLGDWHQSRESLAREASPRAAERIRECFDMGEVHREFVTDGQP